METVVLWVNWTDLPILRAAIRPRYIRLSKVAHQPDTRPPATVSRSSEVAIPEVGMISRDRLRSAEERCHNGLIRHGYEVDAIIVASKARLARWLWATVGGTSECCPV